MSANSNRPFPIRAAVGRLRKAVSAWKTPIVTEIGDRDRSPFKVLISTILSLRTKDETTREASRRLFAAADTPEAMVALDEGHLAELIYPVGFYRQKAGQIQSTCRRLINVFGGRTPRMIEDLLTLPGVGRKTANLVMTKGHGLPGICVDVHVHRITNRWGYVKTKSPDETEMALREKLPKAYWIEFNDLLVTFGQNLCRPTSPRCSECPLGDICPRIAVTRSR